MKIHPDKKKEHLVVLFVAVGILVVLAIWGLQINEMFSTLNAKAEGEVDSTLQDISEAQNLSDQMKSTIPFLQSSFEDITSQWWNNKAAQAEDKTIEEIGAELSGQLDSWLAEQESQPTDDQTAEEENQIEN